jgi:hypothetical protein
VPSANSAPEGAAIVGLGRPSMPRRPGWLAGAMASMRWPSSMICARAWRAGCNSPATGIRRIWKPSRKRSATMWTMPSCRSCTARPPEAEKGYRCAASPGSPTPFQRSWPNHEAAVAVHNALQFRAHPTGHGRSHHGSVVVYRGYRRALGLTATAVQVAVPLEACLDACRLNQTERRLSRLVQAPDPKESQSRHSQS